MNKLKSRADEILDGLNDPETLEAVRRVQAKIGITYSDDRIDRLMALINAIEAKFAAWMHTLQEDIDIERKRIDRAHERLNQHRTDIDTLDLRVKDIEHLNEIDTDPIPEPLRDTSWHAHEAKENYWCPVLPDKRVVVMSRAGYIAPVDRAEYRNWDERGDDTIVAWRYAKEGE